MTHIWFDNQILTSETPIFNALSHGITVGDGVFETCSLINGKPFALDRHLARLRRSATAVGFPCPEAKTIADAITQLQAVNQITSGRLRITLISQETQLGSERNETKVSTLIAANASASTTKYAHLVTLPWRRNEHSPLTGVKSTSYLENVVALSYAKKHGADEGIFFNTAGQLCEGTASNLFVERGAEILTPSLKTGCLAGVTRELALEWGNAAGIAVREAEDGELGQEIITEIKNGKAHIAVSGSIRNINPAVAVDGQSARIGKLTEELIAVFAQQQQLNLNP